MALQITIHSVAVAVQVGGQVRKAVHLVVQAAVEVVVHPQPTLQACLVVLALIQEVQAQHLL